MKKLFYCLLFVLIPAFVSAQEVGKQAPDFTASDFEGKEHKLSDFKGKYVVLEWLNPSCPFVKKHYKSGNMQELQKKYTDKGVVWLTVNSSAEGKQGHLDAAAAKAEKAEKEAHMTTILLDHDGKVGKAYGAKVTPHMFVIDPKGMLIYAGAIDDNNSADAEDAKTAKNYVSAALEESMSGKAVTVATSDAYGCGVKYAS